MKKNNYFILSTIVIAILIVLIISINYIFKIGIGEKEYMDDYSVPLKIKGAEQIRQITQIDIDDFKKNIEYYIIYNNLEDGNEIEYINYENLNNNYILKFRLNDKNNTIIYSKISKNDKKYYFFEDGQDDNSNPKIYNIVELLKTYDGDLKYADIKNSINNLVYNIKKIYINTHEYSDKELKTFYQVNSDELKSIGIYSEEDFNSIQKQIVNAIKSDIEEINNIKIEVNEIQDNGEYYSFKLIILYNNWEKIELEGLIAYDKNNLEKIRYMSTES